MLTEGACERKRATDKAEALTIGACEVFITGRGGGGGGGGSGRALKWPVRERK